MLSSGSPPPVVTIIIPALNERGLVGMVLRNALTATDEKSEVILVDDGSTDGTAEEAERLFGSQIQIVRHDRSQGLAAARNTGLTRARGEFVQFLDADDTLPNGKVTAQAAALRRDPQLAAVYCRAERAIGFTMRQVRQLPSGDLWPELLRGNFIPVHALLFRTEAIRAVGGFDPEYRRCEDYRLLLRLASDGARFGCIPELSVFYGGRPGSLSTDESAMISWTRRALSDAIARRPLHGLGEHLAYRWYRLVLFGQELRCRLRALRLR